MSVRYEYARRCKKAQGEETHKRTHVVRRGEFATLCGKHLDHMWYVLPAWGRTPAEVDCPKCLKTFQKQSLDKPE